MKFREIINKIVLMVKSKKSNGGESMVKKDKDDSKDAPKGSPEDNVYSELVEGMDIATFVDAFYNKSYTDFLSDNAEILAETKKRFIKDKNHKDTLLAWAKKNDKLTEEQKKALD